MPSARPTTSASTTGDDFNDAELVAGDGTGSSSNQRRSDALLGIFDAIAPAPSAALAELAAGNEARFHQMLAPTVPLSRHIFGATTRDLLNDRGMMGDGVIEIPRIRAWVEDAGFGGYSEVEIFSTENWWKREGAEVLDTCISRHCSAV